MNGTEKWVFFKKTVMESETTIKKRCFFLERCINSENYAKIFCIGTEKKDNGERLVLLQRISIVNKKAFTKRGESEFKKEEVEAC